MKIYLKNRSRHREQPKERSSNNETKPKRKGLNMWNLMQTVRTQTRHTKIQTTARAKEAGKELKEKEDKHKDVGLKDHQRQDHLHLRNQHLYLKHQLLFLVTSRLPL